MKSIIGKSLVTHLDRYMPLPPTKERLSSYNLEGLSGRKYIPKTPVFSPLE
jgi:hypothetical protein